MFYIINGSSYCGDIILLDKDYKDVDKNKIGCTLANISLCEYLKLKDLIN